jgi:Reverse transcriptase (RNA-dependent DNA polymerase)
MKAGKASGVDGIVTEILTHGGDGMIDMTWQLCRQVFDTERVPKDWTKGLIFPLLKGGDRRLTDNYRGIYLLSVVGKLYASILNQRLLEWCEKRNKFGEEQGGFRPGRATSDQAFILSEMVRDRKTHNLETHIAFLDIRKAYDTVCHEGLWKRLLDIGVDGRMGRVIRNIYQVVESSVILGKELTDWFEVELGVRQGCTLSPLLFLIFVEGLSEKLRKSEIGIRARNINFNHLLFADDLAICAESREELQKLLDLVYVYSVKWRFKFNISKSNVMVVGKRNQIRSKPYYLGLDILSVVKTYKYLGLDFEDNLRWDITRQRLLSKAKSRLAMLSKALSEGLSLRAALNVWWSMVVPVLNYGSEIWGATAAFEEAEKVQLEAGRRMLGVSRTMANAVMRGELGWWTMRAQRDMKMLMYWARLVRMDDTRLVKQVYRYRKEKIKRVNDWCSLVRKILVSIDLGHVWETELVGDAVAWKRLLKASIQAREEKEWKAEVEIKTKLRLYKTLKFNLHQEEYLEVIKDREERRLITALRGGTNVLAVETGRWKGADLEERTCSVCCTGDIENELHFLLVCSAYERERLRLYQHIFTATDFAFQQMEEETDWLAQMMLGVGCSNKIKRQRIQRETAKFIELATQKRTFILDSKAD